METLRRAVPGARGRLAPAIDAIGLDVVHYPATRMDEPGLRTPSVLTFFDMQEEFLPGHFGRRERVARRIVHRDSVGWPRGVGLARLVDDDRGRSGRDRRSASILPRAVGGGPWGGTGYLQAIPEALRARAPFADDQVLREDSSEIRPVPARSSDRGRAIETRRTLTPPDLWHVDRTSGMIRRLAHARCSP